MGNKKGGPGKLSAEKVQQLNICLTAQKKTHTHHTHGCNFLATTHLAGLAFGLPSFRLPPFAPPQNGSEEQTIQIEKLYAL